MRQPHGLLDCTRIVILLVRLKSDGNASTVEVVMRQPHRLLDCARIVTDPASATKKRWKCQHPGEVVMRQPHMLLDYVRIMILQSKSNGNASTVEAVKWKLKGLLDCAMIMILLPESHRNANTLEVGT